LIERLLAALDAAQAAGGDIRGKQSAALLIVRAKSTGQPWAGADRLYDLRVEDHPEPLKELRRLVRLQQAANLSNKGDELLGSQRVDEAVQQYEAAARLAPEWSELRFWYAVTLASKGREQQAAPIFRELFAKEPFWADLLPRLSAAGLFPKDQALIDRMRALASKK
jgi:uncharacterized Ntn-hydrolase superfamily protein